MCPKQLGTMKANQTKPKMCIKDELLAQNA